MLILKMGNLQILFILTLAAIHVNSVAVPGSRDARIYTEGDNVIVCNEKQCSDSDSDFSGTKIVKDYPGVFMTKEASSKLYNLPYKGGNVCKALPSSKTILRKPDISCPCLYGQHDGDQCCGTCQYCDTAPTFVTVNNEPCWVLQFPSLGQYQLVPVGKCSNSHGSCDGKCKEVNQIHQLLCLRVFPLRLSCAYISMPAYCSCKSNTVTSLAQSRSEQ